MVLDLHPLISLTPRTWDIGGGTPAENLSAHIHYTQYFYELQSQSMIYSP